MSGNALVPQRDARSALAASAALDPFSSAGQDMAGSHGTYMKFNGNSGEFTYGAEAEELELGTKLAVDMNSFRRGWICWKDQNVVEEGMVRVIDGPPPQKHELADHGPYIQNEKQKDGWAEQAAVTFRDITTGKEFIFKVSSLSALRALGQLLKDYSKDYKNHDGELPIVTLDVSSFIPKNKTFGKKYSPKLTISEWRSEGELMSSFGDNAGDYQGGENPEDYAAESAPETDIAPAPTKPATAIATTPGPMRRRAF